MKYAVIKNVNGNFIVGSEHNENLKAAKVAFHQECGALWAADDCQQAEVKIVDELLNTVDGCEEYIFKA